ncbi:undecaprenyl-diphosphatase [Bacillus ectoiniformans]|uniref:YqaA family protein n=1 Tax=Bacillus ectoiniformans TaxID=1494429 RepID=UPI00195B05CD|nr:YqaA family protein [Bacillus ectoiniformans]MBM7649413.1 undecaprenyl-diphosphatase [Bacillus ectoiniformans]
MSELIHQFEAWLLEYGVWGLVIVAFTESSFFPIPPDVILLPLSLADPDRALMFALYTTLASTFGALLGWLIGHKLGRPILLKFISEKKINKVEDYFSRYGALAILIAGFTPIPYKIFTVFSGVAKIPIKVLLIWSFIGRGLRFFTEGLIIFWLGAQAKPFIEENFTMLTIGGGVIILAVYLVYLYFKKRKKII